MPTPTAQEPTPQQFADTVLFTAAQVALAVAELPVAPDVKLLAVYIQAQAIEEELRANHRRNKRPGSPSFPNTLAHMQQMARALRAHVDDMVHKVIPGFETMTEEQLRQAMALLMVNKDDMPNA